VNGSFVADGRCVEFTPPSHNCNVRMLYCGRDELPFPSVSSPTRGRRRTPRQRQRERGVSAIATASHVSDDQLVAGGHSTGAPASHSAVARGELVSRLTRGSNSLRLVAPSCVQVGLTGASAQIAKSLYSGLTASVGGNNIPAATVALVPCSIRMNEPVSRFVV
jgi:hypothetical protein